jgi:hypothetical protein
MLGLSLEAKRGPLDNVDLLGFLRFSAEDLLRVGFGAGNPTLSAVAGVSPLIARDYGAMNGARNGAGDVLVEA